MHNTKMIIQTAEDTISNEAEQWLLVWDNANRKLPPGAVGKAAEKVIYGTVGLFKAAKKLEGVDQETLLLSTEIAEKKIASMNSEEQLIKMAHDHNEIKSFLIKEGMPSWVKLIPVIGPIISFSFATKYILSGLNEYERLTSSSEQLGLDWKDTLSPKVLSSFFQSNKEDLDKMVIFSTTANASKTFVDEVISAIANSIDFVKDSIFALLAIFSGGTSLLLDIGLSGLIFFIEWLVEKNALADYELILKSIIIYSSNKYMEATD